MTIRPGASLGSYSILGSMAKSPSPSGDGELWRAHDPRRGREVGIRPLPPAVVSDHERLALIEAAARTLSGLDHPSVARVYGLEESNGTRFLVAELVDSPAPTRSTWTWIVLGVVAALALAVAGLYLLAPTQFHALMRALHVESL